VLFAPGQMEEKKVSHKTAAVCSLCECFLDVNVPHSLNRTKDNSPWEEGKQTRTSHCPIFGDIIKTSGLNGGFIKGLQLDVLSIMKMFSFLKVIVKYFL